MNTNLSFGEYVRHLRRKRGWGLQDLAQASGLSVTHLSRLENDNAIPNADTVVKLARALDADLEKMLALAKCLPKEILDRLVRRASGGATAYRRLAGPQGDPGFPEALMRDIDPTLRAALARQFDLSDTDVEGLFTVLRRMARMTPSERETIFGFLGAREGRDG